MTKIPITKPFFGAEEAAAIVKPLQSGWVVQGPYTKEFEDSFVTFTAAKHAIATSSCTTALHIAVAALGLKPGDEVIVPAFTWVSTANVVEYMGATPIFCGIDLTTFNIDVAQIEDLITDRTVGIIPVHLFGLCADMKPIMEIAQKYNLWVVEDAACAFGGWYHGQHAGTIGDMGCFSFHPRKSITTGEGGMITTDLETSDILCRSLRDHGASRSDLARHSEKAAFLLAEYNHLGYNYRMTDFQAAVGVEQLKRAEWILSERQRCATYYDSALSDIEWLVLPITPEGYIHGYQAYVTLFQPEMPSLENVDQLHEARNRLMTALENEGISTRQGTHAPVMQGFYAEKYDLQADDYPNAYIADRLTLALPMYAEMSDTELSFVCQILCESFQW